MAQKWRDVVSIVTVASVTEILQALKLSFLKAQKSPEKLVISHFNCFIDTF